MPPFGLSGTKVFIEKYSVSPPDVIRKESRKQLGFGFPIKPDALLIYNSTWLLLESKHGATNSDIMLFLKKREFIWEHRNEPWVHKKLGIPAKHSCSELGGRFFNFNRKRNIECTYRQKSDTICS